MSESGTFVGSWTKIGYIMDNTNNFTYSDPGTSYNDNTADIKDKTGLKGWLATSKANLNDCQANGTWEIDMDWGAITSPVKYKAVISSDKCYMLTPSFDQLTKGQVTAGK